MRIAVVGARGQLGAAIVHDLSTAHDVKALSRADVDVTSDAAVAAAIEPLRPEAIVNCAAYNDVDQSEDQPIEALNVNAFAVRALARAAATVGAVFVHYSTDFVFDGAASAPYSEEDRPNPRSVYGASKLLGEWFAADAPRAYVLRVESLFGLLTGEAQRSHVVRCACSRIARSHRPTSPTRRRPRARFSSDARRLACITASIPVAAPGWNWRAKWPGNSASSRASSRCASPRSNCGPSGRSSARCRTTNCEPRVSPCPPGRMRSRATFHPFL